MLIGVAMDPDSDLDHDDDDDDDDADNDADEDHNQRRHGGQVPRRFACITTDPGQMENFNPTK